MNLSVTANIHEEVWCLLETKGTARKKGWAETIYVVHDRSDDRDDDWQYWRLTVFITVSIDYCTVCRLKRRVRLLRAKNCIRGEGGVCIIFAIFGIFLN